MMSTNIKKRSIGIIKWFGDQKGEIQYGFISTLERDVYFHLRDIVNSLAREDLKENNLVSFVLHNRPGDASKYSARQVNLVQNKVIISEITDWLIECANNSGKNTTARHIFLALLLMLREHLKKNGHCENETAVQDALLYAASQNTDNFELNKEIIACATGFLSEGKLKSFSSYLYHQVSWLVQKKILENNTLFFLPIDVIKTKFYALSPNVRKRQISSLSFGEKADVLSHLVNDAVHNNDRVQLKTLLSTYKDACTVDEYPIFLNKLTPYLTNEEHLDYWLSNLVSEAPLEVIYIELFGKSSINENAILSNLNTDDLRKIFFRRWYEMSEKPNQYSFKKLQTLITISKKRLPGSDHNNLINHVLSDCPGYIKLALWISNEHDQLLFDEYKMYTLMLPSEEQRKFFKKVVKYIAEGRVNLSINDVLSLKFNDYETYSTLGIGVTNYDFSTSIILHIIEKLSQSQTIDTIRGEQKRIFDLIASKIQHSEDILHITGYFNECEGRELVKTKPIHDDEGSFIRNDIEFFTKKDIDHYRHVICDGRKAVKNGQEVLDEKNGLPYWWCGNRKCFRAARRIHEPSEWESYTLEDILTVLNIPFKARDYELYLNIINKTNLFLEHMKCRECKHILFPTGQTNYSFYGVSNFECRTADCISKEKKIYISHCQNGHCLDTIDSRDSIRCKPDGVSEDCGWYICNNCLSCCSSAAIERRTYVLNSLGQEYKCHKNGHKDLGIICCNKCSAPMTFGSERYESTLNWFIENREKSKYVYRSGQNNGRWWFLFTKSDIDEQKFRDKLTSLKRLGFNIPDIDQQKDTYLIGEPIGSISNRVLTCTSCENYIDMGEELTRAKAIKKYHLPEYND